MDPLKDQCYLVYPGPEMCSSGPYNRLRGQKLMAVYEKDSRTKDRLLLLDDDVFCYLGEDTLVRLCNHESEAMPQRLVNEYADLAAGYSSGPLMEQERHFERLWAKNKATKQQITKNLLQEIQRDQERSKVGYICYCHEGIPSHCMFPKDMIMCSHIDCELKFFHTSCIKKLGVEKVSRWYCTACEELMKFVARDTLRDMGYTSIPEEKKFDAELQDRIFRQMLNMPEAQLRELSERLDAHRR